MTAAVELICGRLCSGKSRYSARLAAQLGGVVLSVDELMLSLFPMQMGDSFDMYAARAKQYLYAQALRLARAGVPTVLDFGFWTAAERAEVNAMFSAECVPVRWHYIDVTDADWRRNIDSRNADVRAGVPGVYLVDEGLLRKLESRFEPPARGEMDVWHENRHDG